MKATFSQTVIEKTCISQSTFRFMYNDVCMTCLTIRLRGFDRMLLGNAAKDS